MAGEGCQDKKLEFGARFLAYLLSNCIIADDGTVLETRQRVTTIDGVEIRIWPNDHDPPHFHVRCAHAEACYRIDTCERLRGQLSPREERIVRYWHSQRREDLLAIWKETRPGTILRAQVGHADT
jgi:hypothetical protein